MLVDPTRSQNITVRLRRLGRWMLLGRLARGKLPDRPQNLQTMPERDAEVLQMLVLEFRQNVGVDFALAKNRLVLPKPEAPQPFPDVHGYIFPMASGHDRPG